MEIFIKWRPLASQGITVIRPYKGATPLDVWELWQYRELIWNSIVKEFKLKYVQSVFGVLWGMVNPFIQMVVFSILFGVFARMPSGNMPYPILLFSGILPWILFSNGLMGSMTSLHGNIGLCSKIYFPRIIFPVIKVFSGVPNFTLSIFTLAGMMAYYDMGISWKILWAPLFLLHGMTLVTGVGCALAVLSIHFRDIREIMAHFVQFWYYATPIIYSREAMPEGWRHFLYLNPMTPVIEGFRWAVCDGPFPPRGELNTSLVVTAVILFGGVYLFQRLEGTLIDIG